MEWVETRRGYKPFLVEGKHCVKQGDFYVEVDEGFAINHANLKRLTIMDLVHLKASVHVSGVFADQVKDRLAKRGWLT